jgi:ubiquinone/menaquinone biosynthesis C-methylase UbiE
MQQPTIQEQAIDVHSKKAGAFAESYDELARDPYGSCFAYSRKRLMPLLDRYLGARGNGRRLLDLGCGPGIYMGELRRRGFEVVGLDGSKDMLEIARKHNPDAELHQGSVERLSFSDASFDVVFCIEVLRYLPDARACMSEMARVLKPGGVCIATAMPLFNANGYFFLNHLVSRMPIPGFVPLKQTFTTAARLRRDLMNAGFRDASVHGVYTGAINWVERLAKPLLPTALRAWERIDATVADRPAMRELANMFLVYAVRT